MIKYLLHLIASWFKKKQQLDAVEFSKELSDMANTIFKPSIDSLLKEFDPNRDYNEEVFSFVHFATLRALHLSTFSHNDKQKLGAMMTGFFALLIRGNGEIVHPLPSPSDMESTRKKLFQSFEEYLTDPKSQDAPGIGYTNTLLKRLGITDDPALLFGITPLVQQYILSTIKALNMMEKKYNLSYA